MQQIYLDDEVGVRSCERLEASRRGGQASLGAVVTVDAITFAPSAFYGPPNLGGVGQIGVAESQSARVSPTRLFTKEHKS